MIIFPEGTRVPLGEAPPLQPGFAGLYRALGLPVVPVAHRQRQVVAARASSSSPGTIHFKVGETIPPGLKRDEIEARVHAAINALNYPERRPQLGRGGDDLAPTSRAISASVKLFSPGWSVTSTARLSPASPS